MNLISDYNKFNIVFIHGLGGSITTGTKFNFFKGIYSQIKGFGWTQEDNIPEKLAAFIPENIDLAKPTLIIGSSAGGKISLLLKQMLLEQSNQQVLVCLLNPLADVSMRLVEVPLTNSYLLTGDLHKTAKDALIIWSAEDEVINQTESIKMFHPHNWFVQVQDNHQLKNSLSTVVKRMDEYVYQNQNVTQPDFVN
ncbi:hypothetical protein K5I29_05025 [Flavobacterium agricola]|uniref:Alpha/beta hydrolase family protein n=1 Tax=Flavobacterium agricola TaxID=2870839 RepID=A0ABY6M1F7_9FLAO|nr:hypothetical protein [Flavobacterium agricola]UYW02266.1 hypothetical protein K5I29_05025 [Flavobacterium agricola]